MAEGMGRFCVMDDSSPVRSDGDGDVPAPGSGREPRLGRLPMPGRLPTTGRLSYLVSPLSSPASSRASSSSFPWCKMQGQFSSPGAFTIIEPVQARQHRWSRINFCASTRSLQCLTVGRESNKFGHYSLDNGRELIDLIRRCVKPQGFSCGYGTKLSRHECPKCCAAVSRHYEIVYK